MCNVQIRISEIFYEFENAVFKTAEISAILIANKYNFHRNELFARGLGKGPVGEMMLNYMHAIQCLFHFDTVFSQQHSTAIKWSGACALE